MSRREEARRWLGVGPGPSNPAAGGGGGSETYTISGTITEDAVGVSGVTVSLTGDASDSTSTAGDGTYSFTEVADGSYTVTPTKAGMTFSPTSSAVTVSGGNQTGKDFTGITWMSLPATFDFDAETTGQTPSWVSNLGTDTATVTAESIEGHSKVLTLPGTNGAHINIDLGGNIDATAGIRLQWLGRLGALYAPQQLYFCPDGDSANNMVWGRMIESSSNAKSRSIIRKAGSAWDTSDQFYGSNVNGTGNDWVYHRFEFDPADEWTFHVYGIGGSPATQYPKTRPHASGYETPTVALDRLGMYSDNYFDHRIAEIWIGTLEDSWPTPGVPTT